MMAAASCEPLYQPPRLQGRPCPAAVRASSPASQPSSQPSIPAVGPVSLDVATAVVGALGNNKSLVVERYNPSIRRTFEQQERAAFDPLLTGAVSAGIAHADSDLADVPDRTSDVLLGVQQSLPTGATLGASVETGSQVRDVFGARVGLSATQALLRGFGTQVNLVSLRQAQIDTLSSQYELRGLAEAIVAQAEEAYWDYALAGRQIEIVTQSLDLAQKQLDEVDERIRVGRLAATERAAAQAEVALRREGLIDARSAMEKSRFQLLRLVNPPGSDALGREVRLLQQPVVPRTPLDPVADHLQLAYCMRPDLNQARLQVRKGDLQIVRTRNGLLPRLDAFIALGKTGYARTFGESWGDMSADGYDLLVGLRGEYPLGNRDARAQFIRSELAKEQSVEAVANLAQLVELDVRTGYTEVARAREQVTATAATRALQEEKLRSENEKFRVGRSTSLQVAQVQRDLLAAQIEEVRAVVAYVKGQIELYRLEGSLLLRRGIASPGGEPALMEHPGAKDKTLSRGLSGTVTHELPRQ
jgi:outer membrane protein TolC